MSRVLFFLTSSFASRASLAAGLGLACLVGPALAAVEDTFPREATRAEILRWLSGNSDLAPDSVVTMSDELVVAITARADGRGVGRSIRLTLREEIINPDAAAAWGGRSIQLDLDLDCSRHRAILGARRIYTRPNLQGSVRITRSDNAWSEVPADTVIDDVARAACSARPSVALAAAPPPAPAEAGAPAAAPARTASATPPAPAPQPAAAVAVHAPAKAAPSRGAAAPPVRTAARAAAPAPTPARAALADAKPAPATPVPDTAAVAAQPARPMQVAAADRPPAPAPSTSTSVAIVAPSGAAIMVVPTQPATEAPTPAAGQAAMAHNPFVDSAAAAKAPAPQPAKATSRTASAPAAPPRPAEFAVQIAAATSEDLARDSWQSLKAKLPDLIGRRTFAVEPVSAKGRTLYRALLLGFASPDEAAELCKALRGQSVDCILREMK